MGVIGRKSERHAGSSIVLPHLISPARIASATLAHIKAALEPSDGSIFRPVMPL